MSLDDKFSQLITHITDTYNNGNEDDKKEIIDRLNNISCEFFVKNFEIEEASKYLFTGFFMYNLFKDNQSIPQ